MHKISLFILSAVFAVALAVGQYYIPRAYYTIDAEGHESARVPLRRLRRSIVPVPNYNGGGAHSQADATNYGGSGDAIAIAGATNYGPGRGRNQGGNGGWGTNHGGNSGWGTNQGGNSGWGTNQGGNSGWGTNQGGNDIWGWSVPGGYGASKPVSAGQTRRMYGAVHGKSVYASTAVGVDASGNGYYDQIASTN